MSAERRRGERERRRDPMRIGGGPDRRGGGMGGRRTRFSIFYFLLALLLVLGINYLATQQSSTQIPYSELKARIAAGQVSEVAIGQEMSREVTDERAYGEGCARLCTMETCE